MKKRFMLVLLITLMVVPMTYAKTNGRSREKGFQFGIGGTVSTSNFLTFVENCKMIWSAENAQEYNFPVIAEEQMDVYNELSKNMQRAIWTANLLGSMEYNIQARFLWNWIIGHADISFVPMDGSMSGRFDFSVSTNIGIRAPFFIQPYITAGANFTFSFYPDRISNVESWKLNADYGVIDDFMFRPGVNTVLGLDIKFAHFSFGLFYKYTVKDFSEFTDFYNVLQDNGIGSAEAAAMVFGYQSRVGIAFIFYI